MKIIPIQSEVPKPIEAGDEDNYVRMAKAFDEVFKQQSKPVQKNLTPVPTHHATRTNRVALFLAPMWGPQTAPYGIAKMAGLARASGFETKCWDLNIECHGASNGELWGHLWDWKWNSKELYEKEIHPMIQPLLDNFLDELVAFNPTVIGLTLYYTNVVCSSWIVKQIHERLPNAKIIAGGPETRMFSEHNQYANLFDYVVRGEGEMTFVNLLESLENNESGLPKFLDHDKSIRLDLDSMPIPDYRDFKIDLYTSKGVASEMSRGCIAKCTFCSETTFWRYRGRQSTSILDEVEYNYKTFGIQSVWFIDSLVNGNLKELLGFAQGLIDRNIKINWWGFARNDGRMDKKYLETIYKSGCSGFHFGIETGSQKVIDLIEKKVKVSDVEQNFKDLADIGSIHNGSSWFFGFPGEELTDVAQTLTLLWRLRDAGLGYMGLGTCAVEEFSPLGVHRERYNISRMHFGGSWYSNDFTNTVVHRAFRYKFGSILTNHYRLHGVRPAYLGQRGEQTGFLSHYTLTYDVKNWNDDVKFDYEFDYNIIKPNINTLADTLVNEVWPLLRVLWLAVGPFKFAVKFDPEIDKPVFGTWRYFIEDTGKVWADYTFEIDANGHWIADFKTKLEAVYPDGVNRDFDHAWTGTGNWTRDSI